MKQLFQISFVFVFLLALASVAIGGNLEEGLAAAESGDFKKAYQLWLIEAEKGNTFAQSYLGVLYAKGQGVAQDDKEALKWFRLAVVQGDATTQINLGSLYAKGQGVSQDDKEALKWFRLAAAQGEAKAQRHLGAMYARGRGVSPDDEAAAKWFYLAAVQGDAKAQFSLGVMYDVGRYFAQNYVVACAWYALAAGNGEVSAQNSMTAAQKEMTTSEIEMSRQIAEQTQAEIGGSCSDSCRLSLVSQFYFEESAHVPAVFEKISATSEQPSVAVSNVRRAVAPDVKKISMRATPLKTVAPSVKEVPMSNARPQTVTSASKDNWLLSSREGECAPLVSVSRKVKNIGTFKTPQELARQIQRRGYQAFALDVGDVRDQTMRVKAPDLDLDVLFVRPGMCR